MEGRRSSGSTEQGQLIGAGHIGEGFMEEVTPELDKRNGGKKSCGSTNKSEFFLKRKNYSQAVVICSLSKENKETTVTDSQHLSNQSNRKDLEHLPGKAAKIPKKVIAIDSNCSRAVIKLPASAAGYPPSSLISQGTRQKHWAFYVVPPEAGLHTILCSGSPGNRCLYHR